jgi:hypothetical protein
LHLIDVALQLELVAHDRSGRDRGRDGRDDDGGHVAGSERGEDHLQGEEHPGDRRVEGSADSGPGPGCDQRPNLILAQVETARDHGSHCSTDLDDRAFPPGRSSRADGRGCGQDLQRYYPRPHPAAMDLERGGRFRHTIAGDLGCETPRQEPRKQKPGRDGEKDPEMALVDREGKEELL